ncbi:MAG: DUF971 family protein [Gammaproteobacteria bacterium]|jgi:DUF971 family protein
MPDKKPRPVSINLLTKSRLLKIEFDDDSIFELSCELLRVYSPSAEVRGHGPGQEILQIGKENVGIKEVEAVGNYAVKLVFDDGHDSGIYTWDFLHDLGTKREEYWQSYLHGLAHAGHERKPQ